MKSSQLVRSLRVALTTAAFVMIAQTAATAAVFNFDTDPFAGSTVLQTPGRQFVGNELFIPTFNLASDSIAVNAGVFNIDPVVNFVNSFAVNLPSSGFNFIVLQDSDADGNPNNGLALNAGSAADLIAARITESGAGFFVYFNTVLNLNRLVYSPDLNSPTSDLKIVARFLDQVGQEGIDALPLWNAQNFIAVPEPASIAVLAAGVAGVAFGRRRVRAATSRVTQPTAA